MLKNKYSYLFPIFSLLFSNDIYAKNNDDITDLSNNDLIVFDPSSLFGNINNIDLSRFQVKDYVVPGNYIVSVKVNNHDIGIYNINFDQLNNSHSPVLCINSELLSKINLKSEFLEKMPNKKCLLIKEISNDAYYIFDKSTLNLDIYIPQLYMIERPNGYIDPNSFDNGVTSGFIGYNFNYNKDNFSENKYLSLSGGLNVFGWYFRHSGIFSSSDSGLGSYQSSYNTLYKDITRINSRLTLGQFTTQSRDLDSISIVGTQISSDSDMLPWSQRNSSPVIENIAYTNAVVKIYQNGRRIYEKNVPAGPFKISDLTTYSDGNLILEINETSGEQRTFTIPFFNNVNVLKKGRIDYSISTGKYYLQQETTNDYILQSNINYGISNNITGLIGVNSSQNFHSIVMGGIFNTAFGGFNVNSETQNSNIENNDLTGSKFSINHKYNWSKSKFNISSDYTYYNKNYISLSNHLYLKNYRRKIEENLNFDYTFNLKNSFGLYLSKSFYNYNLGNLRIGYRNSKYWNSSESFDQYTFSYSNWYKKLTYSLNATQTAYSNLDIKDDLNIYLSLSIPLEWKNKKIYINNAIQHINNSHQTTSTTRVSGNLGENNDLSFGIGTQNYLNGAQNSEDAINGYLNYRKSPVTLSSTFNHSDSNNQYSVSADGAIVIHPFGMSLVNFVPTTYTIIHAKGAKGANVENAWGIKIDHFGNAIYPQNMPYQENIISLNPENLPGNVNFASNQMKVIPRKYSSQLAVFNTQITSNILLNITSKKMDALPIGSQLFDYENNEIGILGPTQQILLDNSTALNNQMKLIWGKTLNEYCEINPINDASLQNESHENFKIINVECK